MRIVKIASFIFVFQLMAMASSQAQQIFAAPVPPQIVTAKKVFIANGGRDSSVAADLYTAEPYRAFNQLYGGHTAGGRSGARNLNQGRGGRSIPSAADNL
jgi:hypothetical protein